MLEIFSVTSTIFIIISAGYIAVRVGPFSSDEMQILGKFVINFALPALIVRAVSKQPIDEFANVGYLSAVLLGSLIVFGAGYIWSRKIANESRAASTFSAMGMSCANSGFIGFPILLVTLPNVVAFELGHVHRDYSASTLDGSRHTARLSCGALKSSAALLASQ